MKKVLYLSALATLAACGNKGGDQHNTQSDSTASNAPQQTATPATQAELAGQIAQFLPAGHEILDTAFGNLNGDAFLDVVLIAKNPKEDSDPFDMDNPAPRPCIVLLGEGKGLKKVAQNDNVVLCYECGGVFGDPYNDLTIAKGEFSITHFGGSNWKWTNDLTFRHENGTFYWSKHEQVDTDPEGNEERTLKTEKELGKVPFEQVKL